MKYKNAPSNGSNKHLEVHFVFINIFLLYRFAIPIFIRMLSGVSEKAESPRINFSDGKTALAIFPACLIR